MFWATITRLGEALILLPALFAVLLWLALRHGQVSVGLRWLLLVAVAASVTTVTKLAFIGWGIGHAGLDFTGVSGHAMFACAVLPLLAHAMGAERGARQHAAVLAAACGLAVVVSVSRRVTGVHSASEVLAGMLLGGLAGGLAIAFAALPRAAVPKSLIAGVLVWLLATPAGAPPSPTHGWVTRLALALSGRSAPYTREMLHLHAGQDSDSASNQSHSTTSTP